MLKLRVLIICTSNSARSQIAEGFFRHYVGDEFDIFSAGLDPKPIHPHAIQVMKEAGIDISRQYSKDLKPFLGQSFTYLITVCPNAEARCPIFPGVTYRLFWPFDDPAAVDWTEEEKLARFREIRDQIDAKIHEWMAQYKMKQLEGPQPQK